MTVTPVLKLTEKRKNVIHQTHQTLSMTIRKPVMFLVRKLILDPSGQIHALTGNKTFTPMALIVSGGYRRKQLSFG